uniref:Uncharacterized protein n=1 Tax=Acrobeloides nanus TaxID=290746 RepID=A0A914CMG8_9BILA
MNNHSTWTKITFDPARYPVWWYADSDCTADGFVCTKQQSWTPYVIHPRILNREYATDAMKDIIYECIWYLKTSYGYFCLIQAYIDLILLGNTVIFEGFMSVRAIYIGDYDNLGNVDFKFDDAILPWRWDYLMYYIFYSSKFATSAITFLKAFTRCIAVYLPMVFYYHAIFDEKHTLISCLVRASFQRFQTSNSAIANVKPVNNIFLKLASLLCLHGSFLCCVNGESCEKQYQHRQLLFNISQQSIAPTNLSSHQKLS